MSDRRRPARAVVLLLALASVLSVTAGCGSASTTSAPVSSAAAVPATLVMLIRHGEKPDGTDPGVDAQGKPDDNSLTATGWERANRLVDLFDPAPGRSRRAEPSDGDLRGRRER